MENSCGWRGDAQPSLRGFLPILTLIESITQLSLSCVCLLANSTVTIFLQQGWFWSYSFAIDCSKAKMRLSSVKGHCYHIMICRLLILTLGSWKRSCDVLSTLLKDLTKAYTACQGKLQGAFHCFCIAWFVRTESLAFANRWRTNPSGQVCGL